MGMPKPRGAVPRVALFLACVSIGGTAFAEATKEELKNRLERLEREMSEVRALLQETGRSAQEAGEKAQAADEKAEAAVVAVEEQVDTGPSWADKVHVGGYGSVRFENTDLDAQRDTFTFRRFVLTADARPTDRLQTYFELEFERFAELELEKEISAEPGEFEAVQVVEGTNGSEIAIEQAWARYVINPSVNLDMGGVLVPLGRFNLNHDDNQWNLTRRSLVDTGVPVLPSAAAWPELGVGLSGAFPLDGGGLLDYRFYVVNGVQQDLEFEQEIKSEAGKTESIVEAEFEPTQGAFSSDLNDGKAVTGRLAYRPSPGHELAVSGYYGRYTPEFLSSESVWSLGLDGLSTFGGLELEYQLIHTDWGDVDRVAADFARVVPTLAGSGQIGTIQSEAEFALGGLSESRTGYWLEARYPVRPAWLRDSVLGRGFPDASLEPTLRFEQVFFNGMNGDDATVNRATLGLAYRPVPAWVFTLAGEYTWTDESSLDGLTSLSAGEGEDDALALTAGVAFGF